MELKNSLYQITGKETNGTAVSYDLQLDASHIIYQAHFPGESITPGVCIIQIAKELLEDHTGTAYEISGVKNVKFLAVISPVQSPRIRYILDKITVAEDTNESKVQVQVKDIGTDTQFAKISIICKQK